MIDPSIEPSDRRPNWCYLGEPVKANYGVFGVGTVSTLRTWLSMWSLRTSQCIAAPHLARITVPSLVVHATADACVYDSDARRIFDALAAAGQDARVHQGGPLPAGAGRRAGPGGGPHRGLGGGSLVIGFLLCRNGSRAVPPLSPARNRPTRSRRSNNALRLLLLFRSQPRVRLSEASEHLGVAHSTAHRLLAMLAYHGFVRQEQDSRAYVAGPALVEIGLAAVGQLDIRRHARPALERLAGSLGETVHLAVLEGGNVRYLDAVESPRALRVASRTGSVLAASCTASGKALLAELPDAEVSAMFAGRGGAAAADRRGPSPRARGCSPSCGRCARPGARSTGGERGGGRVGRGRRPRPRSGPAAALVVSAPVSRMTEQAAEKIKQELREQAAWLAARLPGGT